MKKIILLLFIFGLPFLVCSQNFTYTNTSCNMVGTPSITFQWNITFTNPGANSLTVKFERYNKTLPPYWNTCICYITCNPPEFDNFNINLAPFTSSMLTVLFKTDSVNPGMATSNIRIYQTSMENLADTLHLTATTLLSTGLEAQTQHDNAFLFHISNQRMYIEGNEPISELFLLDISGKVVLHSNDQIAMPGSIQLPPIKGLYYLRLRTESGNEFRKKILIID